MLLALYLHRSRAKAGAAVEATRAGSRDGATACKHRAAPSRHDKDKDQARASATDRTGLPSSSRAANSRHSRTLSSLPPCISHALERKYQASGQSQPEPWVMPLRSPWASARLVPVEAADEVER